MNTCGHQKPSLGTRINWGHPLSKGLAGCWLFNEGGGDKVYDLSGHGNNGTLTNMAFPSSAVSGWNPARVGIGLQFDGTDDYINCGNNPSLDISKAITIAAWAKPISVDTGDRVVEKNRLTAYGLTLETNNEIELRGKFGGVAQSPGDSDGLVVMGAWNHLVATYNGSIVRYYINGVAAGTATPSPAGDISTNTNDLAIGAKYNGSANYVNGAIDDVRIYNRALSAQETQQLYIEPFGMFAAPNLPILRATIYPFDDTYMACSSTAPDVLDTYVGGVLSMRIS